jgi:hypothetical protein
MEQCELESFDASDLTFFSDYEKQNETQTVKQARATAAKHQIELRRASSEAVLLEILPDRFQPGESWHVLSAGDVDSLSYAAHIIEREPLEYLLFSTWCMSVSEVCRFEKWLTAGLIGRLDAYVGEIFPSQYVDAYSALCALVRKTGGRVAVFRNHSKIFAGINERFAFAIESSANINTNPRAEQTAIHASRELFDFYKAYYDEIRSFQRNFDEWTPFDTSGRVPSITGKL